MRAGRPAGLCAVLALAVAAAQPGCRDRKQKAEAPPPQKPQPRAEQLEDLRAIPASVQFVIGVHAERVRGARLVERAVEQMFARDRALEARLDALLTMCAFDPMSDLKRLTMGLGSGGDEVVMVVSAEVEEQELAGCLNRSMADLGGTLTSKPVGARTFYRATSGEREVWFAFASASRVAVSPSEEFLAVALGKGQKVEDSELLGPLLARVDRNTSGVWVVGAIPESAAAAAVELTGGEIAKPPTALAGRIDLTGGVDAILDIAMADEADARAAVAKALPQVALTALSAQRYGLGPAVNKLRVTADGSWLRLRITLDDQELNDALFRLEGRTEEVDTGRQGEQDTRRPNSEP